MRWNVNEENLIKKIAEKSCCGPSKKKDGIKAGGNFFYKKDNTIKKNFIIEISKMSCTKT